MNGIKYIVAIITTLLCFASVVPASLAQSISGEVTEWQLPADSAPFQIRAEGGVVYYYESKVSPAVGRLDTATNSLTTWALPVQDTSPGDIAIQTDGAGNRFVWVTDLDNLQIGRLDTATNAFTEWTLPPVAYGGPRHFAIDDAGNIYFNSYNTTYQSRIGRLDPVMNTITLWDLPSEEVEGLAIDRSGRIFYTVIGTTSPPSGNKIGMLDPSSGMITEWIIPNTPDFDVETDSSGNVFFSEIGPSPLQTMARLTPGISRLTEWSLSGYPNEFITVDQAGKAYVTQNPNSIVMLDPTVAGADTLLVSDSFTPMREEYAVTPVETATTPDTSIVSSTTSLVAGTVSGAIATWSLPDSNSYPRAISADGSGAVYFDEQGTNRIGKLMLSLLPPPPSPFYDLNMTMSGSGTVTFAPGYNCSGTCRQEYSSGTMVTLNASAFAGSTFSGWTGCDSQVDTMCIVSMNSSRSVTAGFTRQSLGTGTVYGRITDSSGTGVANAMVRMIQEYNSSACSGPSCMNVFTDSFGNYRIGNIIPGTYVETFYNQQVPFGTSGSYLITTNQWYNQKHTMASADLISVTEGSAIELDAVYPPFGQVSGMVSDTNGTGMANVAVRVYDLDEQATDAGWTNAAGNYTVQHLPSGTYKLRFIANSTVGPLPAQNLVTQVAYVTVAAPDNVTGINAAMSPGRRISGRITNRDGLPVAASAIVIGPNGNIASAPTNTTGAYTIMGVPAGSYKVLFRAAPASTGGTLDATQLYSRRFYGGSADLDNASIVTVTPDADVPNIDGVLPVSGPAIVSSGPAVNLVAFMKDFGVEVVGLSAYRSVTLANSGTADLTLGALSKTGDDFSILNDRCSGITLAPTKICTFQVVFVPLSEGAKTGSVAIPSNDPDIPLFNIGFTGSGGAATGNSGTTAVPYGDNVTAAPTTGVNLGFTSVTSAEGTVTATAITTLASPAPSNFRMLNGASYDITTTASISGPVSVCIIYDPATMSNPANEQNLRLFHYDGTVWLDITTSVDTALHKICGATDSLSPFAVAEPIIYTITASAGAGGSISPLGAGIFSSGASQTYTITPMAGYQTADVLVDGTSVGAVTTYAFTNIKANHTIVASFASAEQLINRLVKTVNSLDLNQGITTSLDAKLEAAQAAQAALDAARANDMTTACNLMNAFINEVTAQSGKTITADQAGQLTAASLSIKAALGCP